jgi:Bacterial SH3 domain
METLQRILGWVAAAFRYWVADLDKRKSCAGKGCSLSIGLFIILMACSIPISIVQSLGRTVGLSPTFTSIPTEAPPAVSTTLPNPTLGIQTAVAIAVEQTTTAASAASTDSAPPTNTPTPTSAAVQAADVQPTTVPTNEPQPTLAQPTELKATATPSIPSGSVTNGGNLRSEPVVVASTVTGQVCPGDKVHIMGRQQTDNGLWYKVNVAETAGDCNTDRVKMGTEGWISSSLISLSNVTADSVRDIPTPVPAEPDSAQAIVMCQRVVKDSLKAPRTAKFPWFNAEYGLTKDGTFVVRDYVDAENSFGAMIRTNYYCEFAYDKRTGDMTDLLDFQFYE